MDAKSCIIEKDTTFTYSTTKMLHILASKNVQRYVYLYTCYSNSVYLHGYYSFSIYYFSICFSLLSVLDSHLTLFLSSHKLLEASISNSSFRLEGSISLSSFTMLCHSPSFAASFTVDLVVWLVGLIFHSSFTVLHHLPSFTANFTVDLVVWSVGSISLTFTIVPHSFW